MTDALWDRFPAFLRTGLAENPLKCEYYLPAVTNALVREGKATVAVLPCDEVWHGVTYREDLQSVKDAIEGMKKAGIYPDQL